MMRGAPVLAVVAAGLLLGSPAPQAEPLSSSEAARQLVSALEAAGVDALAARDDAEPDAFVAALYFPGQLLVVSARHPTPEGVAYRVAQAQDREVYLDLQGTPTPMDKFFVQDAGADGIRPGVPGGGDVDVVYEDGVRQTLFNGDFRGQQLTAAAYEAKLAAAAARYARLLTLLAAELAGRAAAPATQ